MATKTIKPWRDVNHFPFLENCPRWGIDGDTDHKTLARCSSTLVVVGQLLLFFDFFFKYKVLNFLILVRRVNFETRTRRINEWAVVDGSRVFTYTRRDINSVPYFLPLAFFFFSSRLLLYICCHHKGGVNRSTESKSKGYYYCMTIPHKFSEEEGPPLLSGFFKFVTVFYDIVTIVPLAIRSSNGIVLWVLTLTLTFITLNGS